MERTLIIAASILVAFFVVFVISLLSKGRVQVDLYAAVNVFLYFGLLFNLYFAITEQILALITVVVIVCILGFRRSKTRRWI